MRTLISQFARFGVVGFVGLIIDLGVFNLLRATVFAPEQLHEGPVLAKLISTGLAIVANWIGNRFWTFREHRGRQLWREFGEFLLVSLAGSSIGLACLWVSHYVLGFTSILADNISGNVIGLALGTAFRFTFYKLWVFAPHRGDSAPAVFPDADATHAGAPDADASVGEASDAGTPNAAADAASPDADIDAATRNADTATPAVDAATRAADVPNPDAAAPDAAPPNADPTPPNATTGARKPSSRPAAATAPADAGSPRG